MAFMSGLGRKITQTGHEMVQKTKEAAEIIKYNGLISEEEHRLEQIFSRLGTEIYEQFAPMCLENFGDIVAEIKESQAKLQDYKEHIRTVKGIINCPHCGQELSPDAAFCSACGHRLENENTASSAAETERTCPNCNAPMPEDFLFCIECGTPYPQEEPCTEETAPACEEGPAAETETESDRA